MTHDLAPTVDTTTGSRAALLTSAHRLSVFTIGWNVIEGVIALVAAWVAASRALTGFGIDSFIESTSAAILLWRVGAERRDPARAERVERTATRLIGASFVALGAFVGFESIRALVARSEPDASPVGIVLTAVSVVVMPVLAVRKRRVADALGSRSARADSQQTFACTWLSAIVLVGLTLNATAGWWWADPVAALAVVFFLLREGREALTAEHLDDCC